MIVLEYNADDAVLFKCVLCADTETSCYTVQIVESSNDLVDRNYVLQCLYSITYKTSKWCGENPGSTIFDIIDPMRTVSAHYIQGIEGLFCKQFVAMPLTAIIYQQIEQTYQWTDFFHFE